MRPPLCALALLALAPLVSAADKKTGVKSVEATFDPPEAKPGQTVALKLTVELEDGYYTYPLVQPDKAAAGMISQVQFPKPGAVVFVGEAIDPAKPKSKAEPLLGIEELLYYTGTVVYERKAVVAPSAKPGETAVKLTKVKLSVCDKNTCAVLDFTPEAKLKVLDGPAVAVDKKYAAEVEKATGGK